VVTQLRDLLHDDTRGGSPGASFGNIIYYCGHEQNESPTVNYCVGDFYKTVYNHQKVYAIIGKY
jgi:hypothetical protein